ncbi:MAG: hypothetical protein ACUVX9_11690 [Anaerolineae bacterium]
MRSDPHYAQAIRAMQEGNWQEAERLLTTLDSHYGESPDLRRMRLSLALHLSAEQSSPAKQRSHLEMLQTPIVRLLLVINVGLYLVLGALWLLTRSATSAQK